MSNYTKQRMTDPDSRVQDPDLLFLKKGLLDWYPSHARNLPWRRDQEPYHVWISEVMLQQTRGETVIPYYERFLRALPDIRSLAGCPDEVLMKLWEGLGYYSRARNLKKAAGILEEEFGGQFPDTWEEVRSLPGIGDYTASAICSICFHLPEPPVDGNVLRVFTRFREDGSVIDDQKTKKKIRETLKTVDTADTADIFAESLMELGETLCVPVAAPKCEICPVREMCQAALHGTWQKYPVRKPKKKRQVVRRRIWILQDREGRILIRKRQNSGLLAGLWEFPGTDLTPRTDPKEEDAEWSRQGVVLDHLIRTLKAVHIFTHIEWQMEGVFYRVHYQNDRVPEGFVAASPEDLEAGYAIPSAFKVFLKELLRNRE